MKSELYTNGSYFMIEANDDCKSEIGGAGYTQWSKYEIALVGNFEKNITYFKRNGSSCYDSAGNGIYLENTHYFKDKVEVTRLVTTIDKLVKKREVGPFQLMKIDIQGSEIAALHGAIETLRTIEVIIAEASVAYYNQGQPTFAQFIQAFSMLGYTLFDIGDIFRTEKNFVNQVDMLFVKNTSPIWQPECTGLPDPKLWQKKSHKAPHAKL
jgi:FkbM family methyltransferase